MARTPDSVRDLEALLRSRHRTIMGGRPETRPGEFKSLPNRAGATVFVAPSLVRGTLEQGFGYCRSLETPFQRAVFAMFLVAEVHPSGPSAEGPNDLGGGAGHRSAPDEAGPPGSPTVVAAASRARRRSCRATARSTSARICLRHG